MDLLSLDNYRMMHDGSSLILPTFRVPVPASPASMPGDVRLRVYLGVHDRS